MSNFNRISIANENKAKGYKMRKKSELFRRSPAKKTSQYSLCECECEGSVRLTLPPRLLQEGGRVSNDRESSEEKTHDTSLACSIAFLELLISMFLYLILWRTCDQLIDRKNEE